MILYLWLGVKKILQRLLQSTKIRIQIELNLNFLFGVGYIIFYTGYIYYTCHGTQTWHLLSKHWIW